MSSNPVRINDTGGSDEGYPTPSGNHVYHFNNYSNTHFHSLDFEVSGREVEFVPQYYPERVTVGKERDLVREKSICMGEYVNDVGTKNREIHVVGKVITPELDSFHNLVEYGNECDLYTMPWAGEVYLEDSELEGPIGVDVMSNHFMYDYTLDFVSTGRDELNSPSDGIMSDGEENEAGVLPDDMFGMGENESPRTGR